VELKPETSKSFRIRGSIFGGAEINKKNFRREVLEQKGEQLAKYWKRNVGRTKAEKKRGKWKSAR